MSTRARLSPLGLLQVGSILLPAAIIILWGGISWRVERDRASDHVRSNAEILREYSLRVFETQQSLLTEAEHLIGDIDIERAGQLELHERLRPLVGRLRFTLGVGIISAEGEILASTTYPTTGRADHRAYFQKLRDDLDDLFIERVTLEASQTEALLVAKRRPAEGFEGVLVAAVDVEAVTEFFARIADDAGASAALVGSDGSLLLRYPPRSSFTFPADAPLMQAANRAGAGVFEAPPTFDDVQRLYAFSQLDEFPAFVVFGEAEHTIFQRWLRTFLIVAGLFSIAAVLAFAASTEAARRVKSEERQRQLAFDRHLLEEAQRAAENRGELLREAHHRIKNNLQMILAMIRSKGASPAEASNFRDIENRILALSQVHDLLYNAADDGSQLDLGRFLESICRNPSILPPERGIEMDCEIEPVEMEVAQAVPVALIAVEALTNSLKHAFPHGRTGRIALTVKRLEDTALISIRDDGVGLPASEDRKRFSGLQLINGLARQLSGRLEILTEQGTEFRLYLPLPEKTAATDVSPADHFWSDIRPERVIP